MDEEIVLILRKIKGFVTLNNCIVLFVFSGNRYERYCQKEKGRSCSSTQKDDSGKGEDASHEVSAAI